MSHCIEATGEIDAPLALVYQVVADVASYPEFVPGVQSVTQAGDAIEMTVRLGPIDVSWMSRATFRPHASIVIQLVDGPFEQMDVRWTFVAKEGKTEVTCITEYKLLLPIPGIRRIVAKAIETNTADTVRAFRKRIQDMQDADAPR